VRHLHSLPTSIEIPTNAELIEKAIIQSDKSEATQAKYREHLHEFDLWLAGSSFLDARQQMIDDYMAYLKTDERCRVDAERPPEKRKGWKADLSWSARRSHLSALKVLYHRVERMELIVDDPAAGAKLPSRKRRGIDRPLTLTTEQIVAFLTAPGGERDRI
jgi:site-specific recombinase XerD